ncbi:MAG: phosphotransferase [bacterium]|nr:phosphotransferase [bacterium]
MCRKAFPSERRLSIDTVVSRTQAATPHQEYSFFMRTEDTDLRILLRLYFGLFSVWGLMDEIKAGKEYAVLRHVYKEGYPAPFSYAFSAAMQPFGRPYLIADPGDGEPWFQFLDSFREVQEKIIASLAGEMVKLHRSIEPRHPLLPIIEIEPLFQRLWARVAGQRDQALKQCLERCLNQMTGLDPLPPVLLHGCLDLDHVLIQTDTIRTVTNWEHAAIGDPRWDVAYTALAVRQAVDRPLAERFVQEYITRSGVSLEHMEKWEAMVALRMYTLCQWVQSLDDKSNRTVTGTHLKFLEQKDFYRERAFSVFG